MGRLFFQQEATFSLIVSVLWNCWCDSIRICVCTLCSVCTRCLCKRGPRIQHISNIFQSNTMPSHCGTFKSQRGWDNFYVGWPDIHYQQLTSYNTTNMARESRCAVCGEGILDAISLIECAGKGFLAPFFDRVYDGALRVVIGWQGGIRAYEQDVTPIRQVVAFCDDWISSHQDLMKICVTLLGHLVCKVEGDTQGRISEPSTDVCLCA